MNKLRGKQQQYIEFTREISDKDISTEQDFLT